MQITRYEKRIRIFFREGILRFAQDDRDWRGAEGDETEAGVVDFLFFPSPSLEEEGEVIFCYSERRIRVPFGRRGWETIFFPSPSLEEDGEVIFCHS